MKITKILMATTVLAFSAATVNAATQGLLDATSSGTALVTMDVLEQVQINAIADFTLDNGSGGAANTYEPGAGDVSATTRICVHYNNSAQVTLTIESANPGGANGYRLTDGTDFIDYDVEVDEAASGTFLAHVEGAVPVAYNLMADPQANCGGGNDTDIRATVPDIGLMAIANGTYTDTLTYTLAPNP
ncbi:MAG: hypothetical protein ACI9TY_001804 [Alphaproteobacteria bacterium]|jgi:hypothetical protein